jgi:hypothetical protein
MKGIAGPSCQIQLVTAAILLPETAANVKHQISTNICTILNKPSFFCERDTKKFR